MAMLMQFERTALMYAAVIGDDEIFDLLIEHSADVMMKDCVSFI